MWLIPAAIAGAIIIFSGKKIRPEINRESTLLVLLLFVLIIPFLISLIRRDAAPDRTFVNLVPFFAMFTGISIHALTRLLQNKTVFVFVFLAISTYCFLTLSVQMNRIDHTSVEYITTTQRSHNITYNYYQHHFEPMNLTRQLLEIKSKEPVYVVIMDSEPYDLPEYFRAFNIPVHPYSSVDSVIEKGGKVFLYARFPSLADNDAFKAGHHCTVKYMNDEVTYHNGFILERTND